MRHALATLATMAYGWGVAGVLGSTVCVLLDCISGSF
jgi:hypothetical protein